MQWVCGRSWRFFIFGDEYPYLLFSNCEINAITSKSYNNNNQLVDYL